MPSSKVALPNQSGSPLSSSNSTLENSAIIERLVSLVSVDSLRSFLTTLTGFQTRQSQSTFAVQASAYLQQTFSSYGFNTTRIPFRAGYSDNVIAERRGSVNPNKIVIIGAHYDCRMATLSSTTARAPGANDDGSGTVGLLEIARVISLQTGLQIPFTLRLTAFSGEEQGLYGSTAYAQSEYARGADIVFMGQIDMIAYQAGNFLGLDLGSRFTTPALNAQITPIIKQYVPELTVGSNSGCCSDQQPFFDRGYPAASLIHQGGATIDPQYHQTGDVVDRTRYSIPLVQAITRAVLASAATIAGL